MTKLIISRLVGCFFCALYLIDCSSKSEQRCCPYQSDAKANTAHIWLALQCSD